MLAYLACTRCTRDVHRIISEDMYYYSDFTASHHETVKLYSHFSKEFHVTSMTLWHVRQTTKPKSRLFIRLISSLWTLEPQFSVYLLLTPHRLVRLGSSCFQRYSEPGILHLISGNYDTYICRHLIMSCKRDDDIKVIQIIPTKLCHSLVSLPAIGMLYQKKWPIYKGGLTTRFDPPPNGLRELKLHRSSTNVCTKTKMF